MLAARRQSQRDVQALHKTFADLHGVEYIDDGEGGDDVPNPDTITMWTQLAARSGLALPDLVRLFRGQTTSDMRPNKDLYELPAPVDINMDETIAHWNAIVRHGVIPRWTASRPAQQPKPPSNHGFTSEQAPNVRRHLRKGQRDGRYLIVEDSLLQQWPEVVISPLGVVEKRTPTGDDIRIINDYSYPDGRSVNDFTLRDDFPTIQYNPPSDIARRIHELKQHSPDAPVLMMVGDVSGAFRHIPVHAEHVHMFAFKFDGYVVIDLACGFGWCGSPAFYSLVGKSINYLYETAHRASTSRLHAPLRGNVWCDDHTCIEIDRSPTCFEANLALRDAIATVLGPTAINEEKFTLEPELQVARPAVGYRCRYSIHSS